MHASHTQFDIKAIQTVWQAFDSMAHLRPIHSKADYTRMVSLMNAMLAAIGDDEDHTAYSGDRDRSFRSSVTDGWYQQITAQREL